jgi:hypothetical protein
MTRLDTGCLKITGYTEHQKYVQEKCLLNNKYEIKMENSIKSKQLGLVSKSTGYSQADFYSAGQVQI